MAAAGILSLNGCIHEVEPRGGTATQGQVTYETILRGIPAAMVKSGSAGYAGVGQAWDFGYPAMHIATESMTGDLAITGNVGYDWFNQWGTNEALGSDYAVCVLTWNTFYTWISMANDVIGSVSPEDIADGNLDAQQRVFLGYAYTYRALFYFDLVRLYEFKKNNYTKAPDNILGLGVPVVLPGTTEAEGKNNPRARVEDIYNDIIFPDLDKAESLLSGYNPPDKYAVSLPLVHGLMARAWLERATTFEDESRPDEAEEAYRKAARYARETITTSGCTPLTQSEWEDPSNGFNNASSNNSWIWALSLPSESVTPLFCFTAHMSNESWSAYAYAVGRGINKNLYNSIGPNDFRKHSWLDPDRKSYNYKSCRPDGEKFFKETLKDYANIKFRPAQGAYQEFMLGGAADHCCMRVEEMYFIEAEATAHTNLAEGIRMLNEFMAHRMTGGAVYDCTPRSTTLERFVQELMLQKRIEFWGEGIVMFDMKRLNISSQRGYVGTNSPVAYRLNCEGRAPYWNFVISRGEVMNNTALPDNNNPDPSGMVPGWSE